MAGPGRPKKHVAEDLHFKSEVPVEAVVENPTVSIAEELPKESILVDQVPTHAGTAYENPSKTEIAEDQPILNAISTESPIEEKIHELVYSNQSIIHDAKENIMEDVEINGWSTISSAPLGGLTVKISDNPDNDGIDAFYKRTRVFNGKRFEPIGKWVNHMTGVDIPFEPKYWKERF